MTERNKYKIITEEELIEKLNSDKISNYGVRGATLVIRYDTSSNDETTSLYNQTNDIADIRDIVSSKINYEKERDKRKIEFSNFHDYLSFVYDNFTKDRQDEKYNDFEKTITHHWLEDDIKISISCSYIQPYKNTDHDIEHIKMYDTLYIHLVQRHNFSRRENYYY